MFYAWTNHIPWLADDISHSFTAVFKPAWYIGSGCAQCLWKITAGSHNPQRPTEMGASVYCANLISDDVADLENIKALK